MDFNVAFNINWLRCTHQRLSSGCDKGSGKSVLATHTTTFTRVLRTATLKAWTGTITLLPCSPTKLLPYKT
jgi:hypothetical protein